VIMSYTINYLNKIPKGPRKMKKCIYRFNNSKEN
jgi:hypothetical protein